MKLKIKKNFPYLIKLVAKLAPKVGASFVVEPKWGYAGQLTYKNKVTRYVRHYSLDLNSIASSEVAKDKDYAKFFMQKKGYRIVEGKTFYRKDWAEIIKSKNDIFAAKKYAREIGYPIILKPNSKSQGVDVFLVINPKEFVYAFNKITKDEKIVLVEKYIAGKDYRIVVLDNKVISAYERVPLFITGNGVDTILTLLKKKQKLFLKLGRDAQINLKDERISLKLKRQNLNFTKILPKGKKVFLLDNANLSSGGEAIDVSKNIHPLFKKIAIKLTADMGLRMSGVDLIVSKGNITENPKDCEYFFLEINSTPGFVNYISIGKTQKIKIEKMYLRILKALGKKN